MIQLTDITLVVLEGNHTAVTEAAVEDVFKQFMFEDVLIFRDTPSTPFRSVEDATRIAWREVWPRLKTTHAMSMHWDGYPVRPYLWNDGFRDFDYIGAVWPWFTEHQVGNSGFSLQSRKFLQAIYEDHAIPMKQPEDITLCREWRPYLEQEHGIHFAPESIADRFSVEHGPANPQTLGFHGVWNFIYHMDDDTVKQRLTLMGKGLWARDQVDTLAQRALIAGRRDLYRWVNKTRAEVMSGV